ncbi:ABC transporter ATP-binding protein [Cryobacterium sp. Y82]|uniref:ABC transporter ATP-binding protein n=1 Tax=Cryobacterium sp. Y82 TaxID=2045017 RepID=UPI000CE418FC|nr:ABC transporter ATP-binding protein [Cryobacterium sp. Y82]
MTETLKLTDVSRDYGHGDLRVRALDGVSLTVRAGELIAVMGPSGSGKSTLLGIAGGMEHPSSGEVIVDGTPVRSLNAQALAAVRRWSIGFIFQNYNLIPILTVLENVAVPLELDDWGGLVGLARRRGASIRYRRDDGIARCPATSPVDDSTGAWGTHYFGERLCSSPRRWCARVRGRNAP